MKSLFWILSCCFVFSFVLAAPVRDVIEPALPNTTRSINTTHFSERDPLVPLKVRAQHIVLKSRRQLEFFGRWLWGLAFSVILPPRDDVYLLRALEDPIFITAYERPSTLAALRMDTREDLGSSSVHGSTNQIVRDILELALGNSEYHSSNSPTDDTVYL
ncbi:hypothetical protein CPB84DRAFT_1825260 [Gymnopilus junonius]|uniref:Uncharacterized protein n=1 Tax=Gymnopilus junonius TaxID=109634 RepID=A0A9P5NNX9_GYMJU|nr:hypothetical protein CPB84DRAFT_1825260 [Gymnopilus junonius]